MSRKWVVNASPLIRLGKIGRLDLLRALSSELVIPSREKPTTALGDGGEGCAD